MGLELSKVWIAIVVVGSNVTSSLKDEPLGDLGNGIPLKNERIECLITSYAFLDRVASSILLQLLRNAFFL